MAARAHGPRMQALKAERLVSLQFLAVASGPSPDRGSPVRSAPALTLCLGLMTATAVHAAEFPAAEFDISKLTQLLREKNPASVEQALALLPVELRSDYVLVFASRSLQGATPSAPRAILYGKDARFIVSFNGAPDERGFEALETLQFDDRTNAFHFREVTFSATGGAAISEDNPARCTACHGRPARPVWDTAPSWPGVYGERYHAGLSKAEHAGMQAFLAHQAQDPRYRYLIGARRFAERETYVASAATLYHRASFEPPNARLSELLATLNVRSLVAELAGQPMFAPYRYVLLAAAGGDCGSFASFFPPATRDAVTRAIGAMQRSARESGTMQEAAKQRRRSSAEGYSGMVPASDPTLLRFIAERLVGMPPQRWSLALEGGTYDLAAPDGALSLEQLLFERLAVAEPTLREQRAYRSFGATDNYCSELRRGSERELTALYRTAGMPALEVTASLGDTAAHPAPPLLDHCIACHNGEVGPALPFADPGALGARLTTDGGYPRGRLLDEILYRLTPEAGAARMPRDINSTPNEQHELEDYFLRLAAQCNSTATRIPSIHSPH